MTGLKLTLIVLICCGGMTFAIADTTGHADIESRLFALERKVNDQRTAIEELRDQVEKAAPVLLLFAAFCALWAQNVGRSAFAWFFLGLFFNIFTIFFVLYLNPHPNDSTPS